MPRLARTTLTALLAATVVALPALSAAQATPLATPLAQPAVAEQDPSADASEILDRVIAAFAGTPASRSSRPTDAHGPDVTLLLRDLRAALPSLTGAEKKTAQAYLARPRDPGGDNICSGCSTVRLNDGTIETSATTHFLIHYQSAPPGLLGRNQVTTPQQLAETRSVLEKVYNAEVVNRGYRKPLGDQNEPSFGTASNPDGKIDVFLADTGDDGIYGYVSSDSNGAQQAPYIVLDNDFAEFALAPKQSLRVTAAHEFFHAIQFAYDANEAAWFTEGTATWMEDIVYPTINDYVQYLDFSQIARPGQSINFTGGLERYGAVSFWKFLSEGYYDEGIIKSIWTAADAPRNKTGLTATKDLLKARGHAWGPVMARSAIWNTLPPGSYTDRGLFPSPGYWAKATLTRRGNNTGSRKVAINHLASAPLYVFPGSDLPSQAKLRFTVNGPNTAQGTEARVQLRMKSGKVHYYTVKLNATGFGSKTVYFNRTQVGYAILTMTNASTTKDNQPFAVSAKIVY